MLDKEGRVAMADVTCVQVEDHFDLENGGGGTFIYQQVNYIAIYAVCIHRSKGYKWGGGKRVLIPLKRKVQNLKSIY